MPSNANKSIMSTEKDKEEKKIRDIFADRLDDLIKGKKITSDILSKETKIAPGSISNYLNSKTSPSPAKLKRIASFFNVSIDYLLGEALCKIPTNEDIYRKTGLEEKSIEKLISYNGSSGDYFRNGINLLLSNQYSANIFSALDRASKINTYSGNELFDFNNIRGTHLEDAYKEAINKGLNNLASSSNLLAELEYSPKEQAYSMAQRYFIMMFNEISNGKE